MKTHFLHRTIALASLSTLAVVVSGFSAQAETTQPSPMDAPASIVVQPLDAQASDAISPSPAATTTSSPVATDTLAPADSISNTAAPVTEAATQPQQPEVARAAAAAQPAVIELQKKPVPGTSLTAAAPLTAAPITVQPQVSQSEPTVLAQTPEVTPGRATRSGSSYIGVGGNIGVGDGDTALGEGSFAIISKIGLTRVVSVRPSLLVEDDVTILLPVTYDFSSGVLPTGELGFRAAPYVGIGPAISTGDGASVDLLLTGGVDVPLSRQFTATAALNATVTGNVAVGLLIGVGYNFSGF